MAGFYEDRGYTLEEAKNSCLGEIESWYGGKTLDVFDSAATGVARRYFCAESDQLRMVNGRVSNTSMTLMCGVVPADPELDPTYDWLLHSAAECGKVHTDYVQFSKNASALRTQYISEVNAATTVQQVDLVFAKLV